jgi:hypothetical protein
MDELLTTTVKDLIPHPPKPPIHEKMTFEAIIYALNWNDNNPDPSGCFSDGELEVVVNQLPQKVDGCAQWVDKLADDAKRAREYARKFTEAARQIEAQADRFEGYVLRAMKKNGFEKLPGEAFQVSIRKSSSVSTTRSPTADDALSDLGRFIRTKIAYEWDKAAIKDALKAGNELDFAHVDQSTSVQFSIRKG